ncbi:DUF4153 domain-containing protein [Azospirillum sp. B4]|uniref:DUF4153 domain-containing protein n=1 Tax=Azospirillum sp. B4 TaxID=95605 RepID=UPI0003480616|nr:DUF4153 domain-containing protein [Azospirillum sp. B4]
MTTDTASDPTSGPSRIFAARLLIALVQAAGLYLLIEAATIPLAWPATVPTLFIPLLMVWSLIPLLALLGVGQLPRRPLLLWLLAATVVVAGLGYYGGWRLSALPAVNDKPHTLPPEIWSYANLWLRLAIGLFIAHTLVVDGVIEGRWRPSYARHFDTAWKQAVQAVLTGVFVAVFWLMLHLGAGLFQLLKITVFQHLIEHDWFAIPATTLAMAAAIHITDVQPPLIRGARTLALTLFSWLLPLLVVIVVGFLSSLPFLSLQPLWQTHFAAALLLTSAGLLIFLINCCYQDGAAERTTVPVKRWAGTVGALTLTPLVALAAWALGLRVGQYGWTTSRVEAAIVILGFSAYAAGYVIAALRTPRPSGPHWLRRLEFTNHLTAHFALVLLLAVLTPLADPARLMVASQMARLRSGVVAPTDFDLTALRFDGVRWGRDALMTLREATDSRWSAEQTDTLHANATIALTKDSRYQAKDTLKHPVTAQSLANRITVYPAGQSLPPDFLQAYSARKQRQGGQGCLVTGDGPCNAYLIPLHTNAPAVLIEDGYGDAALFERNDQGAWLNTGMIRELTWCAATRDALQRGDATFVPSGRLDLEVAGMRLAIGPAQSSCPAAHSD